MSDHDPLQLDAAAAEGQVVKHVAQGVNVRIVEHPAKDIRDIPRGLRALAQRIEDDLAAGLEVHNVAWVSDYGNGDVRVGMVGCAVSPGAEIHLLLAIGQRRLEGL